MPFNAKKPNTPIINNVVNIGLQKTNNIITVKIIFKPTTTTNSIPGSCSYFIQ